MAVIHHRPDEAEIARRFTEFAEAHWGYSPLYAWLAAGAAGDRDMLALLGAARPGQRRPVLVFAAVQYLLLSGVGVGHPLRRFYPSVGGEPASGDICSRDRGSGDAGSRDPWPAFRDFCLDHREAVLDVVSARTTQTNEVGRCAGLYPALSLAGRVAGRPLGLVEVGASAGLNLRIGRYAYRYSTGQRAGAAGSPLTLDCELTGPFAPPLRDPARIGARVGVDIAPVDVTDDDAVRWLVACVYADQPERVVRLRAAVDIARRDPVPMVTGSALDVLAEVVDGLPAEVTPCLLHTWVVTYFRRDERARLVELVGELAKRRPLVWISSEPPGTLPGLGERPASQSGNSTLGLAHVTGREVRWRTLGRMQSHGAWLEWSDPASGEPHTE